MRSTMRSLPQSRILNRLQLSAFYCNRISGHYAVDQFCKHYHRERNHQGLENKIIEPEFGSAAEGEVNCRERLGGLLRYYYRDAA